MDNLTKEQRKKNMSAIRSKETKIELLVSKALWKQGIRFRKNVCNMYGKPDIAIKKYKIVLFLDSCFWHKCPEHYKKPKSNNEYWDKKIARNVVRDEEVNKYYEKQGWYVLRVWEHDFKTKDIQTKTINRIITFVESKKECYLEALQHIKKCLNEDCSAED